MRQVEKLMWQKYFDLQGRYASAINEGGHDEEYLDQLKDSIDFALNDLEDIGVDVLGFMFVNKKI